MWRKSVCAAGAVALACAAAYVIAVPAAGAGRSSLDLSWLYSSNKKGDRLPLSRIERTDDVVMAFNLPSANTTVVAKGRLQPRAVEQSAVQAPRRTIQTVPISPVREISNDEQRKIRLKLPEGCEPNFSPVTVPALAHVAGRCVS